MISIICCILALQIRAVPPLFQVLLSVSGVKLDCESDIPPVPDGTLLSTCSVRIAWLLWRDKDEERDRVRDIDGDRYGYTDRDRVTVRNRYSDRHELCAYVNQCMHLSICTCLNAFMCMRSYLCVYGVRGTSRDRLKPYMNRDLENTFAVQLVKCQQCYISAVSTENEQKSK